MTKTITGIDVLRGALKARNKSPNAMSLIASEIDGVGVSSLEDFADGKVTLGVMALQALTKILFDAEFDAESGMLRSANRAEPITMGDAPPPFDPKKYSPHHAPIHGPWTRGRILGLPPSPQARSLTPPGSAR